MAVFCRDNVDLYSVRTRQVFARAGAALAIEPRTMVLGRGPDVAPWPGLTPRENSTGGKQRLGGISKRGSRYIRTLLVHCARSGLETLSKRTDRLGRWLRRMLAEKDRRTVIVALAARLARIAWAILSSGQRFGAQPQPAQAA